MLSVVGMGMVSAAGARVRDHAFFPRAEGPPPAASPFKLADGRRWDVQRCRWVAPLDAAAERIVVMARQAIDEALDGMPPADREGMVAYLCLPAPRPGLDENALTSVVAAVEAHLGRVAVTRLSGAAHALAVLGELPRAATDGAVLVVAADTFVSLADAVSQRRRPPSPWLMQPVPAGEGAAALLFGSPATCQRWGRRPLAQIERVGSAMGTAHDDNDEPIDALAMTEVMRGLTSERVAAVFGQGGTDHLRIAEWERMVARLASQFDELYVSSCIETEVGRLGAAAGAMNLAHAVACLRHDVLPDDAPEGAVVVWALSRDGRRAAATVRVKGHDALVASRGEVRPREVARQVYLPAEPVAPVEEEPADDDQGPTLAPGTAAETLEEVETLMQAEAHLSAAEAPRPIAAEPRRLARELLPVADVFIDAERAQPVTLGAFYEGVVRHAADNAAMLLRDRTDGAWEDRPEAERRLLCQVDAVVAAASDALGAVSRWWDDELDDAWSAGAATLLALAFGGEDAADVVLRGADQVLDDDVASVAAMSEAVRLSAHPAREVLVARLRDRDHAVSRALSLVLSEPEVDTILLGLADDDEVVRRAALWVADALPPEHRDEVVQHVEMHLDFEEAWPAARLLSVWGRESGFGRIDAVGAKVAELFVLRGRVEDTPLLEAALRGQPVTPGLVDAVARFGAPQLLPWLIGLFADPVLAEDAADGLTTMLGTTPVERLEHGAWSAVIERLELEPSRRYRRGLPWSPAGVIAELGDGTLSRAALELRVDELRAHLDVAPPALWRFGREAGTALEAFVADAKGALRRR